jgi:hypothetical protein
MQKIGCPIVNIPRAFEKKTHFSVCEHNRHISVFYEKVRLPTGFYKKDPTQFIGLDRGNKWKQNMRGMRRLKMLKILLL